MLQPSPSRVLRILAVEAHGIPERAPRKNSARTIAWIVGVGGLLLSLAFPSWATPRSFDQPAQPLGDAIAQFARTMGLTISVEPSLVAGKRAAPLVTTAEPAQALEQLLWGSGLTAVATTNGFAIQPAPQAPGVIVLPPINVIGKGETAWSQVDGYVANRSQTATKTDTPILETPQSIAVVTRDEMSDQDVQSVKQALRYTQGTTPDTRANFAGFDVLFARGFTLDRYLDGLKLLGGANYTTPQIDPYSLERIDILLGPVSTLYGQASPGGIVDMISKRPTSTPQGEVRLAAGRHDQFEGAVDVAGPLSDDGKLLYRITASAHSGNTQVDHVDDRTSFIAPSLTWRPDANTELTVLYRYQDTPSAGLYNFVPAEGSLLGNPNGTIPTNFYSGDPGFNTVERKQWSLGYLFEHRFDDVWTVRQNFRYMRTTGTVDQLLPLFLDDDLRTLERYSLADAGTIKAYGVDTQVQARFATGTLRHLVLAGIDYQQTEEDDLLGLDFGPPIDLFAPVYGQAVAPPAIASDTVQTQRQIGYYLQDQMKWDRWSLSLGLRQDHATTNTNDRLAGATSDQTDNASSGRVGLLYLFDSGIAPYASYVTSFQPVPGTDFDGAAFKPTRGRQSEAGLKYQPLEYNALFTLALFNLEQSNVPTADPDHPTFNVQTGKIRSRGVELSGKATLAQGLSFTASYTYLDSTVLEGSPDNQGKTPLYTPKNAAAAWLDYRFHAGSLAGLGIGAGVRYVGSTFGDDANTLVVPSNTLVDLALRYDLNALGPSMKGMQLAFNATNLFDKQYVSECTNDNCVYGLRRGWRATLSYRW